MFAIAATAMLLAPVGFVASPVEVGPLGGVAAYADHPPGGGHLGSESCGAGDRWVRTNASTAGITRHWQKAGGRWFSETFDVDPSNPVTKWINGFNSVENSAVTAEVREWNFVDCFNCCAPTSLPSPAGTVDHR